MMKRPLIILAVAYLWLWLIGYAAKGAVPFGFWKPNGLAPHATLNVSNVGYWKLDETSGTRADSSGMGNLITLTAQTNSVGYSNGVVLNSARFSPALTNYLSSETDATNFSMGDIDFSVSFWVKLVSITATNQTLVGQYKTVPADRSWQVLVDGVTGKFRWLVTSDAAATTSGTVYSDVVAVTNHWYHIVVGHNSTSNHVWMVTNGVSLTPFSYADGVHNSTAPLTIGALGNPSQYTDGVIDEVGIWKKVLSPSEIADLFTTNRTCCPFPQ